MVRNVFEELYWDYPLISHDKTFLDNITNRTIELANSKLYDYKCNYTKYMELREEEIFTRLQPRKIKKNGQTLKS